MWSNKRDASRRLRRGCASRRGCEGHGPLLGPRYNWVHGAGPEPPRGPRTLQNSIAAAGRRPGPVVGAGGPRRRQLDAPVSAIVCRRFWHCQRWCRHRCWR